MGIPASLAAVPSSQPHSTPAKKEIRFAILDHDYVMEHSVAANKARKEIDARRSSFQSELEKEEQRLRAWETSLIESQKTLSEEEYAEKRQEWENIVTETHKSVSDKRLQIEETHNHARETIVEAILKIVAEVSKERGYDVVLPRSMVFYAEESYDITDEILKRLDKQLPSVILKTPSIQDTSHD